MKKNLWSEIKTFFLASQKFSFRLKKLTSKSVADTAFTTSLTCTCFFGYVFQEIRNAIFTADMKGRSMLNFIDNIGQKWICSF